MRMILWPSEVDDAMRYEKSLWKDEFVQFAFQFEGRMARIIFPHEQNKTDRWLLKTEYFSQV